MADVDGRLVLYDGVEPAVDFGLCNGIQCGGGLIQDDEGRILVQGPGQRDLLLFPAGHVHAVLVQVLAQISIQALGKLVQPVPKPRFLQAGDGGFPVIGCGRGHVLAQRQGCQGKILEYHRENGQVFRIAVFADIDAV